MFEVPATNQPPSWRPNGMRAFTLVWVGQLVSLLGSAMTGFAMTFWAWKITGQATALALVGFFSFGPSIIASPFAGALVDRWNRKLVMMISDLAAGLSTIITLILYSFDALQIWHLYFLGAFVGIFQSFQWPAYSAAISTMLPKKHYARANGMLSIAESASNIAAPILASLLLAIWSNNIAPVLIIDCVTFTFAIGTLLLVHIPQPTVSAEGANSRSSLWREAGFGFKYIRARPSLLGLQLVFFAVNFLGGFAMTLVAPMILARTDSSATAVGTVQSAMGIGGLLGGLLLSLWGGPRRKIHGVLIGMLLANVATAVLGMGRSLSVWMAGAFMLMLVMPTLNGSNQAIWQSKVPPDLQGRVFAVRRLIAQISSPLAILSVGPLVDYVMEPQMQAGGALYSIFAPLVGSGPGAGMAVVLVVASLLGMLVGLAGYLFPAVRNVETLIPDHADDAAEPPVEASVPALAEA